MAKGLIDRALRLGEGRTFKEHENRVSAINAVEPEMELLDDDELLSEANALRERAGNGEPLDDMIPEAFALCREAARRAIGQRHFDVQLIGGMVLHSGSIAEMKTGEGKTLTATLPVFLNSPLPWKLRSISHLNCSWPRALRTALFEMFPSRARSH